MSLINEALKKAQRSRHEDQAGPSAPDAGPGIRIPKRSKAQSANVVVLIGSGALVLIVLSVVATVYLVNRPAHRAADPVIAARHVEPAATPSVEPAPPLSPPLVAPAAASPAETVAASPAIPSATALTPPLGTPTASAPAVVPPDVASPSPAPPPAVAPTPVPAGPDERISAFVEAIRVTGIRSSGNESRVLMNERVFRVNDIVERTLNLRLIKVTGDTLTFSDVNGITYEKHF